MSQATWTRRAVDDLVARVLQRLDPRPAGDRVEGLDVAFQESARGNLLVALEWDSWMGFSVVAKSPEAEPIVQGVARFLAS